MAGRPRRARPRVERPVLDEKAARLVAFELLAQRARSTRDLARRLRLRCAPADVAEAVVADLAQRRYLDDDAFARGWAQGRAAARRVGSRRLRQELTARGIAPATVASAIETAFGETSELDRALDAGRRRLVALRRGPAERLPVKLAQYLLRRGYPPSLVRRVVKQLAGADPDEPDSDGV